MGSESFFIIKNTHFRDLQHSAYWYGGKEFGKFTVNRTTKYRTHFSGQNFIFRDFPEVKA